MCECMHPYMCVRVCMCVCVRERERVTLDVGIVVSSNGTSRMDHDRE